MRSQGVMPAVLVITGGIGSGKSLVCSMLAAKGLPVYDSDSAAKRLYDTDDRLLASVVELFGRSVLDEKGRLDRKALAAVVFSDTEKLAALECLVHPAVFRDFDSWKNRQETELVVYESALALQKGLPIGFADELILVDAPLEQRLERACRRDGRPKVETEARAKLQKVSREQTGITYVLDNDGTIAELAEKVGEMYEKMITKYKKI